MVRNLSSIVCGLIFVASSFSSCKPAASDSDLQSIVSSDEKNAFGLAGVRLLGNEDKGIRLAIIQCESSDEQKAANWLLQAINLGVFGETYLERDGQIKIRNEFGNKHNIPCKIARTDNGQITSLYNIKTVAKAFSLAKATSSDSSEAAKKKFLTAQTLFLSMRGPSFVGPNGLDYSAKSGGTITFATYHELARADGTMTDHEVTLLADNIKQRDPIYNPCDRRSASSMFKSLPSSVDAYKDEFYSCHRVANEIHVYKLKSNDFLSKLSSVVKVMEAAYDSVQGGPRLSLTAEADEERGFSLDGTTPGPVPAPSSAPPTQPQAPATAQQPAAQPAASPMDVFAPAKNEVYSNPASATEFDKLTGQKGTDQVITNANIKPGDGYVIGVDNGKRQPSSLFQVPLPGQSSKATDPLAVFTKTKEMTGANGAVITQSTGAKTATGQIPTAYDAVIDGQRKTQVWMPSSAPGIEGFKAAFPEATQVTASRLAGVQGEGAIEQYSFLNAKGERQYALGIGGIPDGDSKNAGKQGLFVPMEKSKDNNSLVVSAQGLSTVKKYTETLSSDSDKATAQAVFNQAADKSVLNSDISKGPVGMGYFSTVIPGQSKTAVTPTATDDKVAAFNRPKVDATTVSKPVMGKDGEPVFTPSRVVETQNIEQGWIKDPTTGQMVKNTSKINVRSNVNLDPKQTETLLTEAQQQHVKNLEERARLAREQYATDRKIYTGSTDPNAVASLEASQKALANAEQQVYNQQMRTRPDYLQAEVTKLEASVTAAEDAQSKAALSNLLAKQKAALAYAEYYKKNPMTMDLEVDGSGKLVNYNLGGRPTTTPKIQAAILADYQRDIKAANNIYGNDTKALASRIVQIKQQYANQGLATAWDD